MLKKSYTLDAFVQHIHGELIQKGSATAISRIALDSRKLYSHNDELAFIAINGLRQNAHEFLPQVYEAGVRILVVCEDVDTANFPEATIISVSDGVAALQSFAAFHRDQFKLPVVAITGSNGKTIVKEWAYQLLFRDQHIVRSPNSYNSQVGVPLSVILLNKRHELAIFEAGISQNGEMEKLEAIIQPTIGIFTNIGPAHQENFESISEKVGEKLKLFKNCERLIYCKDHHEIAQAITESNLSGVAKCWSVNSAADLEIYKIEKGENQTRLWAKFEGESREITLPFTIDVSIENACHLWLMMLHLKKGDATIAERMSKLSTIPMRLEQLEGINNCVIVNDVYNSDLNALGIALDHLMTHSKNKKSTAIVSDIIGSGQHEASLYKTIAHRMKMKGVDRFIGIGPKLESHRGLFSEMESQFYTTTQDFIDVFEPSQFFEENILIKGARPFEFERISDLLQEKTHETVLEIDLNKMADNLNYVREMLKPDTQIMAMVKAFAYGSGSYDVARFIEFTGVDYLAVAYADEGISLREDGLKIPIMVLNPETASYESMIRYQLEPQVYNFRTLEKFTQVLKGNLAQSEPYPIHIKINTGMNRLGFDLWEMESLGASLSRNNKVKVKSVFSHLSSSDDADLDSVTVLQVEGFQSATAALDAFIPTDYLKHILNSNGILRHPEYQMDMVRLGIALYGISSNEATRKHLHPVSSLKTTISQIRDVAAGEGIGYGPKTREREGRIVAVLPIGYADGLPRALGNGVGRVYINGEYAKIVGNICMDMCMVDVTNIECFEGDQAEIFGDHISIYEIADQLNTIPYEVLTNISQRVKRVSIQS